MYLQTTRYLYSTLDVHHWHTMVQPVLSLFNTPEHVVSWNWTYVEYPRITTTKTLKPYGTMKLYTQEDFNNRNICVTKYLQ